MQSLVLGSLHTPEDLDSEHEQYVIPRGVLFVPELAKMQPRRLPVASLSLPCRSPVAALPRRVIRCCPYVTPLSLPHYLQVPPSPIAPLLLAPPSPDASPVPPNTPTAVSYTARPHERSDGANSEPYALYQGVQHVGTGGP